MEVNPQKFSGMWYLIIQLYFKIFRNADFPILLLVIWGWIGFKLWWNYKLNTDDAKLGIFFILDEYIVACYAILILKFSNDTKSNIIYLRPRNGQYLLSKVLLTCSLSHYSVHQKDFSLKIIYREFNLLILKCFRKIRCSLVSSNKP